MLFSIESMTETLDRSARKVDSSLKGEGNQPIGPYLNNIKLCHFQRISMLCYSVQYNLTFSFTNTLYYMTTILYY